MRNTRSTSALGAWCSTSIRAPRPAARKHCATPHRRSGSRSPAIDAEALGIGEGDWVRVTSRRGKVEARATVGDIEPGQAFVPFHFGYWDAPGHAQAANELTIFDWDPVSKQPHFKYAAVAIERIEAPQSRQPVRVNLDPQQRGGDPSVGPAVMAAVKGVAKAAVQAVTPGKPRAHLADYLGLLDESEKRLIKAFDQVRETHHDTPDVVNECKMFAQWANDATASLQPFIRQYGERKQGEPERLDKALLVQRKKTGIDLLRDMHDLFLLVNESLICVTVLDQAALGMRDKALRAVLEKVRSNNDRMREWLYARCRQAAPQVLLVPS